MPLDHRTPQPRPSAGHDHSYRPAAASSWTDPDPKTVGSALDDLHQILDETIHAGVREAISISDEGGINISWGAGKIYTPAGDVQATIASDGPQACTDNAVNHLIWASGSGLTLRTAPADAAIEVCIGHIQVQDGDIWEIHTEPVIPDTMPSIQAGLRALLPIIVSDGLLVSEDADVTNAFDVAVSAGSYWHDAHDLHSIAQFDTRTANTLIRCYIDGSGPETWDFTSGQHSIDVANWNSGTSLVGTSVGKYYRGMFIVSEDNVFWIYAQEQHNTVAEAIEGANPSVPAGIALFPTSVAYIYKHGDAAFDTAGSDRWLDVRPRINTADPGSVPAGGGSGDVVGPAGATDLAIAIYNGATGKIIKNSTILIDGDDLKFAAANPIIYADATEKVLELLAAGGSAWLKVETGAGQVTVSPNKASGSGHLRLLGYGATGKVLVLDAVDPTKVARFDVATIGAGATRTFTFPNATGTFVLLDAIQAISNKTTIEATTKLTSPKLDNAGDITLDAVNAAAHSSVSVENSDGTHKGGLKVEGCAGVGRKDHGAVGGSPLSINWLEGNLQTLTLGINLTINFGTAPLVPTTGMAVCYLKITNGAGTAYTVTFSDVDGWGAQETFVMSTGLGDIDIITFYYDGANYWAVPFGQNFGIPPP